MISSMSAIVTPITMRLATGAADEAAERWLRRSGSCPISQAV
jgi:hypothetical protein